MALPALDLLADRGFALTLGRPLLGQSDLFSAYPWKVVSLSGSRIQALRDIRSGLRTAADQLVQHRA